MGMTKLFPIADAAQLDYRTISTRASDSELSRWVATQYWKWEGGDAIVVVVGELPNVTTKVVLRLGDNLSIYTAVGLKDALKQAGQDPARYVVG